MILMNRSDGTTPLYVAAENGYDQMIRQLIDALQNTMASQSSTQRSQTVQSVLHSTRDCGASALSIAAQNGHLGVIEQLLSITNVLPTEEKASVIQAVLEACNRKVPPPLYLAAQNGHLDIIEYLTKLLQEALAWHPEEEKTQIIEHVLNKTGSIKATPLYIAAKKGHQPVVEWLLAHGADPKKGWVFHPLGKLRPLRSLLTQTPRQAARKEDYQAIARQIKAAEKKSKATTSSTQAPVITARQMPATKTTRV